MPPKTKRPSRTQPLAQSAQPRSKRRTENEVQVRKRRRQDPEPSEPEDSDSSPSDEEKEERDDWVNDAQELLSRKCQLHLVSELKNFNPTQNQLARYERAFAVDIQEMTVQSRSFSVSKTSFKFYPRLADRNSGIRHSQGLFFLAYGENNDPDEDTNNNDRKIVFRALLFSAQQEDSRESATLRNGRYHFPVVISRGPDAVLRAFRKSFEANFLCWLSPLDSLSPPDVKIIGGNWLFSAVREQKLGVNSKILVEFDNGDPVRRGRTQGILPLEFFDQHIPRNVSRGFSAKRIIRMWIDVLNEIEGDPSFPLDVHTPVAKIRVQNFMISNDGMVRVGKSSSVRQFLELFHVLTWVALEGYERALRPPPEATVAIP